jgi:hypothetical protein
MTSTFCHRVLQSGAFTLLFVLFGLAEVSAQQLDSAKAKQGEAKTSVAKRPGYDLPDSLYVAVDSIRGDIDTIVYYKAKDSTNFDVANRMMILTGESKLDFRTQHINAHRIVMDFTAGTMTASSETYDSVLSSVEGKRRRIIRDTSRVASRGAPKLIDGTTPYEGELIVYNFNTKQGTVALATSSMEGGYYYGEKIKQVEPKTLFIENGRYTTCDAPTPHFYFESDKMKLISGDQVFAQPVLLYIADVPIFALPFGVFPNHQSGRRSGLIAPSYTTQSSRGYGLLHLGYYQVFDDYFDAAFKTDIYTRGGYNLTFMSQYMKRYLLKAPIQLELGYGETRYSVDEPYTQDFKLGLRMPGLVIDPRTSVSADLTFSSIDYNKNNANTINDLVNQTINSRASFSTVFEDIDFSLGASYGRVQNLNDGTYNETSPSVTWGKITPITPFANMEDEGVGATLRSFQITYGGGASRSVNKTRVITQQDTSRGIEADTSYAKSDRFSVRHAPGVSISPKLGYISITPSFSYNEIWFFTRKTKTPTIQINEHNGNFDTVVVFESTYEKGLFREPSYNYGLNFNTTMYGTANVGLFGLKALRHTIQPNISFHYTPDLSSNGKAYYTDPITGKEQFYSIYEDDGGYIGSAKSGRVGFALGNDFEAKVDNKVSEDSSFESKVKLLNVGVGTGYDIIQELFTPLSVNGYSQIGNLFSFSAGANFSWYPSNYQGGDSTEHTLISLGQGLFRTTNVNFSLNGSFSSSESSEGENLDSLYNLFDISSPEVERQMMMGGNFPGRYVNIPYSPRWSINYGLSYGESYNANGINRSFSGNANISLNLTKHWRLSTYASYDFVAKEITVPNISISRDLHCWELNFNYRPVGLIKGFNLELRIKADMLKDIKLTRQESTYGTF